MLRWLSPLDPSERKDYSIDWTQIVGSDTITGSVWELNAEAVDAGITLGTSSIVNANTIIWLSVDENYVTDSSANYLVSNTITTIAGRLYKRSVVLSVRSL